MPFFRKRHRPRVLVIGLDGVPYSFLKKHMESGDLPNLAQIAEGGTFRRINSVYPTVSSVAWASYMTGKNPAGHGIFGFIDRRPNPFKLFIPNARNLRAKALWEVLGEHGEKVVVINVPVTYPPSPVNGILIGGFLGADVNKIGYPPEVNSKLLEMGYRIDVDAWKGRQEDKGPFLENLHLTLDKRCEVASHFLRHEDWDFFQLHIMETDRINHFLWEHYEQDDPRYAPRFLEFYRKLDRWVGKLVDATQKRDKRTTIVILSDHGFCSVKKEVYINHWLQDQGYLKFEPRKEKDAITDMSPESKAYSLIPGRVFVNLKGREQMGSVGSGSEYEGLREELSEKLMDLRDPDTDEPMVKKVYRREELYRGPYLDEAADLIVVPHDGYDLKGNVKAEGLTHKGELVGMHTYDDAAVFVWTDDPFEPGDWKWIGDVGLAILAYFDAEGMLQ
ncbi:MAG TPA: nucleotide pyrophosphatase [Candidatus Latescibacteria bacterium]|nr:nucleotide pyrophosphatase [Candidatus Latescibacterota bacterium]